MTGIILAGGKNSRMGENKAFLKMDGERLIDRTVRLFRTLFNEVIIVTTSPGDYLDLDVEIVTDIHADKGPLDGIYTGLFWATQELAFVAACDMPFLNRAFLEHMIFRSSGYDIVVPSTPDGFEPLHAIYSRRCLPAIRSLLQRDRLKITGFYKGHRILTIPQEVVRSFDPEMRMFMNVNTPENLRVLGSARNSP
jgi:molybdopterin-guanine dinucleotide biosynthesis protein A